MTKATPQKTYLDVPFDQKDAAKQAGALWDKSQKAWFARGAEVPAALKAYLPKEQREKEREDPRLAFGAFLREKGAELKGEPQMDGQWHRIGLIGEGKAQNASYRAFLDGVPNGQFKNFKGDEIESWQGEASGMSPADQRRLAAQAEKTRDERDKQRAEDHQAAAKRAFGIWTNLKTWATPDNCPYLGRKQVRGFGVKLTDDGLMVVPLRDTTGRIWSLQFVGDEKNFLKNGRKEGLHHTIDPDKELQKDPAKGQDKGDKLTIVIGEGYATGADVHKATKLPTFVAFDGDNLVSTAKAVREKYPQANILIAADDDHHLQLKSPPLPNKGLKCAQRAADAVGGKVLAPSFTPAEKSKGLTDWNDLKQERGEAGLLSALRLSFSTMQRQQKLEQGKGLEREREMAR
ncbi:DUF5710 domain-containing protein [Roseibium algae]|uniref:DUF5710 domain-containing protein n=1 Tax=Roseibium algae TaxID=3123038 RepID=A0ABU8TT63_9HYPH